MLASFQYIADTFAPLRAALRAVVRWWVFMSDVEWRQTQQRALGVAACAAAFVVGGPLISYSAEIRKADEDYRADVGRLSVALAQNSLTQNVSAQSDARTDVATEFVAAPSSNMLMTPVSYEIPRPAAETRVAAKPMAKKDNRLLFKSSLSTRDLGLAEHTKSELDCLSEAIYYEARSETVNGQMAVAEVVLNRVADSRFPNTVCDVVFQGQYRRTGCQFTFTCDGSRAIKPRGRSWERARQIALHMRLGLSEPRTNKATHYHTDYVNPYWSPGLVETAVIDRHIFYRFPNTRMEWTRARFALEAREQHRQALMAVEEASADEKEFEAPREAMGVIEISADSEAMPVLEQNSPREL